MNKDIELAKEVSEIFRKRLDELLSERQRLLRENDELSRIGMKLARQNAELFQENLALREWNSRKKRVLFCGFSTWKICL